MSDLAGQLIAEEEGPSSAHVYPDSRGLLTIARGCLVDPKVASEGLAQAAQDAQNTYSENKALTLAARLPGFAACNDVRQAVLTSMCYQLGDLAAWPGLRAALGARDYAHAADEMLASAWHTQTPKRCERAAAMMRAGEWIEHT